MRRVMTTCPTTGLRVGTHAAMTASAFNRLKTGLAFYCGACRQAHVGERHGLWLEDAVTPLAPPGQSPPDSANATR
jgi:hypothetical protein